MNELSSRITKRDNPPSASDIEAWIESEAYKYWKHLTHQINQKYPKVFIPEWLYGGQKHGWTLRYKKNKSFCTFIPEKNRFALLIVFGADERAKVEAIRDRLSAQTQKEYDNAKTYHDGNWVVLTVDSDRVVKDVILLLAVKRKSKLKQ